MKYIKKKDLVNGSKYWVRLPENMPNGKLNEVLLKSITATTVSVDLAHIDNPYRMITTFQFNTIDFVELIGGYFD